MTTLHEAATYLAGRCDRAVDLDGAGFNAFDADFGHSLADRPEASWTPKMYAAAYKMLRKYRGQLAEAGIDFDAIPGPEEAVEELRKKQIADRRVELHNDDFVVHFPYDPALIEAVRLIPGRKYRDKKQFIPTTPLSAAALSAFVEEHSFKVSPEAAALIEKLASEAGDVPPARSVLFRNDRVEIRFMKDRKLIDQVKQIPGSRWDPEVSCWWVPATEQGISGALAFGAEHGLEIDSEVDAQHRAIQSEAEELASLSRSEDFDLEEIEGLKGTLYPFQRAGVAYARRTRKTLVADQMGLGKTVQAIVAVFAERAYPAVVLCPASLKYNWAKEWRKWTDAKVLVLEGRDQFAPSEYDAADVIICNYDLLRFESKPQKRQPLPSAVGHLKQILRVNPEALIFDESHYCKNGQAIRTKATQEIARGADMVLALTGTPVVNRPEELVSQLRIIGRLKELGGWKRFMQRYCGAYQGRFGWETGKGRNLDELNDILRRTCYIRRLKSEVLPELPAKIRSEIPVEISNRKEYNAAALDAAKWFAARSVSDREFQKELRGLDKVERENRIRERAQGAEERARKAETLTRISALKRVAAKGKMEAVREWIADFVESGEKLVVFAHHKEVVQEVAKAFGAPYISGDVSSAERERAVERFQNDPETRLIVLNMKAGGVGLTLTAASNVAFIEQGWSPADHDQAEDRCHRIGQEDSVTAWYFLGTSTIDEDIAELIEEKREVVDALTEGGKDASVSIASELASRLAGRAG